MVVKIQKPLAIIVAVVLTLLLAVGTAVPAFAEEISYATPESGSKIVYNEPDILGEKNENYITLPDAPQKDGYIFTGWRVNGSKTTYSSGATVPVMAGEEVTLTPVYCSDSLHVCAVMAPICFAIFFTLFVIRAFRDFSDKTKIVLNVLIVISVIASGFFIATATITSIT